MNEPIIQNQIKLVGFKAVRCSFFSTLKERTVTVVPSFNLDLDDLLFHDNPHGFAKVFKIDLKAVFDFEAFDFNIEYHAIFETEKAIDGSFLASEFATISAPAIGFPYVRSFVSNLSLQAGIPPIILPSINFIQWAKLREKKETV